MVRLGLVFVRLSGAIRNGRPSEWQPGINDSVVKQVMYFRLRDDIQSLQPSIRTLFSASRSSSAYCKFCFTRTQSRVSLLCLRRSMLLLRKPKLLPTSPANHRKHISLPLCHWLPFHQWWTNLRGVKVWYFVACSLKQVISWIAWSCGLFTENVPCF